MEFGEKEEKDYMGSIAALFMYLMIIGFIAVVAYFVIKKAIKDILQTRIIKAKNALVLCRNGGMV